MQLRNSPLVPKKDAHPMASSVLPCLTAARNLASSKAPPLGPDVRHSASFFSHTSRSAYPPPPRERRRPYRRLRFENDEVNTK